MAHTYLDIDARGVIHEAYLIDGITEPECRSIFLDWAMFAPDDVPVSVCLDRFMQVYGAKNPDHPMTVVIAQGQSNAKINKGRRGGRAGRQTRD